MSGSTTFENVESTALSEPQRRKVKVGEACENCRRQKIRCLESVAPCSNCVKRKLHCDFSRVKRPRKTPKKNSKRVEELEQRVKSMERLLTLGKSKKDFPTSAGPDATSSDHLGPEASAGLEESLAESSADTRPVQSMQLPPPHEAVEELRTYFADFNKAVPLYEESSFMKLFHTRYTQGLNNDPSWWASLNIIFSITCHTHARTSTNHRFLSRKAERYLNNAKTVLADLLLGEPSLMTIQALLGMVFLLQASPHPQHATALVAAAVRQVQALGLHRCTQAADGRIHSEQERRVYWIAHIVDRDYSLAEGNPPSCQGENLNCREKSQPIELPSEIPEDGAGIVFSNDGRRSLNLFRMRAQLSMIKDKAYYTCCVVRPSVSEDQQRLDAFELDTMLQNWKNSIPFEFQAENIPRYVPEAEIIHLVGFHLWYFDCLAHVHGLSARNVQWEKSVIDLAIDDTRILKRTQFASVALCLSEARSSLRLIKLLPTEKLECVWLLLYYVFSSIVVILSNALRDFDTNAIVIDLELVDSSLLLLDKLEQRLSTPDLTRMRLLCSGLRDRASRLISRQVTVASTMATQGWPVENRSPF